MHTLLWMSVVRAAVPMAEQNRFLMRWKLCHLLKLQIRNLFAKLVC